MRYLITGGTGTFGTAILEALLRKQSTVEVRVFSRDETKQHEMKGRYDDGRVTYWIGDVRDRSSIDPAMHGIDVVFHAAAMKHVWSCEDFPMEAVKTNIEGVVNVIDSAIAMEVTRFVLISSDKAVYPVGVMGMTKAIAERVVRQKARGWSGVTRFTSIRFGNLINSRGSVTQVWHRQRESGRPLTVTDTNATRYFITIEDAVDAALGVINQGGSGEVRIPKMKATDMDSLLTAYMRKYEYNEYEYIGLQPGERKHEFITEDQSSENADMYTVEELKGMI